MATITNASKTSRLDMRMSDEQRSEIERAASVKGMSLTQWALQNLLAAARRDIQEETVTRLSMSAFDQFKSALDAGMPRFLTRSRSGNDDLLRATSARREGRPLELLLRDRDRRQLGSPQGTQGHVARHGRRICVPRRRASRRSLFSQRPFGRTLGREGWLAAPQHARADSRRPSRHVGR